MCSENNLLGPQSLLAFFDSLETALFCVGRKKKLERSLESEKTVTQKKEAKPSVAEVKTEQPSSPATPTPAFSLSGTLTLKCYLQSSRTCINILNFLQSEWKFHQFFPNFQHAKLKILLHFTEFMILFYLLHMLVHRQFRIKFQCCSNINLTFQTRM